MLAISDANRIGPISNVLPAVVSASCKLPVAISIAIAGSVVPIERSVPTPSCANSFVGRSAIASRNRASLGSSPASSGSLVWIPFELIAMTNCDRS